MDLSLARARYLSAIGVMLPALAASACKEPSSAGNGSTDGAATVVPIASVGAAPLAAEADASPTAALSGTTPPPPTIVPRPLLPPGPPRCPSGEFCSTEPATIDPKDAAPSPFGKCALVAKPPSGDLPGGMRRSVQFSAADTTAERAKTPNACCYTWVIPCPGGRAFRDDRGASAVARVVPREDWLSLAFAVPVEDLSPEARRALAAHWTSEAAFEHASIASFAQLTLDLMAVGAPPELLASAQRAALDEIEHARVAFALAAAYGGTGPIGPGALAALPGRARSLAELARTTFLDACVGESVAAAALAERAREAESAVLRDLLASMAADEERHAELAWTIVAWALRSGDPEVARALDAARAEVVDELAALTGALRGNELRVAALRDVVLPCANVLLVGAEGPPRRLRRRALSPPVASGAGARRAARRG